MKKTSSGIRIGFFASTLTALTLAAACGGGAISPALAQTGDDPCTKLTPPPGANAQVAQTCDYVARNPNLSSYDKGIAFYHTARAYLADGNTVEAARSADQSYAQWSDDMRFIADTPESEQRSRRRREEETALWRSQRIALAMDRADIYVRAFEAVGAQFTPAGAGPANAPCVSPADCSTKALDRLRNVRPVVSTYALGANGAPTPQYDAYFMNLARLYRARGGATDATEALNAYKAIMGRNTDARNELYQYALERADAAAAEEGTANTSLAIRYYSDARDAFPGAAAPYIGIGNMNTDLGRASEASQAGTGAPQFREAELAFSKALESSPSEGEKAEALIGRGSALFALGDQTRGIADYQAASQLASSFDVYVKLAEVFWDNATQSGTAPKGSENQSALLEADKNYGLAIANMPAGAIANETLSDIYLHYADTRSRLPQYTAVQIRPLLDQAVLYNPSSSAAKIKRAAVLLQLGDGASTSLARQDLLAVTSDTTNSSDVLANAYATLATTYATGPSKNWASALLYSENARERDGSNFQYRMQACVARLMATKDVSVKYAYGYRVVDGDRREYAPEQCTQGTTAKDLMMQGMYVMAKTGGTTSRTQSDQIRAGQTSLVTTALSKPDVDEPADFNWPPNSGAPSAKTKAVLVYIREASLACTTRGDIARPAGLGLTDADYSAAEAFLRFYGVFVC